MDVAKALVKIYSKIKDHVEYFVGYLITSLSTVYLITRSENSFFSSNPSLSSEVSRFKDIKDLEPEDKISVLEKMIEKIIELNKKNLFILDIDLNNLIFSDKQVLLSDLRKLRMSTHPKALIDSLKSLIINLLERKIIKIEEAEYLLSYYMGGNPEVCSSWYKLKNKKDADEIDVLYALEQEIIEPRFA